MKVRPTHLGDILLTAIAKIWRWMMEAPTEALADSEIASQIFDASTLEDAIAWRRVLARRLCARIAEVPFDDPYYGSKVGALVQAKVVIDVATNRLLGALSCNERTEWFPPYPPSISHRIAST